MIRGKKAIELPVTFIVILIITIILLGLSLYFLGTIKGLTQEISDDLDKRTIQKIEQLIRNENNIVAIGFSTKTADIGTSLQYGIGIKNIVPRDDEEFSVHIQFDNAYTPEGRILIGVDNDYIMREWVGNSDITEGILIERNKFEAVPILLRAGDRISSGVSTLPGDYVFNVCVLAESVVQGQQVPCESSSTTGQTKDLLYPPGNIYQITVRVR